MNAEHRSWQELCEAAIQEYDPAKLRDVIAQLMHALDERDGVKSNARNKAGLPARF